MFIFHKFGIIVFVFLSLFIVSNILITKHYMGKVEKLKAEIMSIKKERDDYKYAYEECQSAIENMKVDYDKKMREYIKKLNEKTKYDKLKEIPKKDYEGKEDEKEHDECKDIKDLLEIYKDVERSSYFKYRIFNKLLLANSSE